MRGLTATVLASLLSAAGCGGPWGSIAGGALAGEVRTRPLDDWTFAERYEYIELETRPADPYSVTINYYLVDGGLYIEAGARRWSRWRRFLHDDPRVRVRFGESVYAGRAIAVDGAAEISRVLPAYYAKDRAEPTARCARSWSPAECEFSGRFYRIEADGAE